MTTAEIIDAVCREYGVTQADLRGRSRIRHIARARQCAMAIIYRGGMSCTAVGQLFRRDRTTVLHANERMGHQDRHMDNINHRLRSGWSDWQI